jgi:hypothetical protein
MYYYSKNPWLDTNKKSPKRSREYQAYHVNKHNGEYFRKFFSQKIQVSSKSLDDIQKNENNLLVKTNNEIREQVYIQTSESSRKYCIKM